MLLSSWTGLPKGHAWHRFWLIPFTCSSSNSESNSKFLLTEHCMVRQYTTCRSLLRVCWWFLHGGLKLKQIVLLKLWLQGCNSLLLDMWTHLFRPCVIFYFSPFLKSISWCFILTSLVLCQHSCQLPIFCEALCDVSALERCYINKVTFYSYSDLIMLTTEVLTIPQIHRISLLHAQISWQYICLFSAWLDAETKLGL